MKEDVKFDMASRLKPVNLRGLCLPFRSYWVTKVKILILSIAPYLHFLMTIVPWLIRNFLIEFSWRVSSPKPGSSPVITTFFV